jgi:murein DD-endopeptidase MepM/ murein hydrolase activator NlpD
VLRAGYDPVPYGNHLLIGGEEERRSYFYAHLPRLSPLRRGDHVWTGQRVGAVGDSGNARTIGCHLHFEIHAQGQPIGPAPALHRWDRYS